MFCTKCGNAIKENEKFCTKCGNPVNKPASDGGTVTGGVQTGGAPVSAPSAGGSAAPALKLPNIDKKKLIMIGVIAVVVIAALAVIVTLANTVNVKKYISDTAVFEGYDGYGKFDSSSVIDYEGLADALGGSLAFFRNGGDIEDYFDMEYEYDKLKNGDVLTVDVIVDVNGLKNAGFKKKVSAKESYSLEYTVEGLKAITVIDPFEAISGAVYDKVENSIEVERNMEFSKTHGEFTTEIDLGYFVVSKGDERITSFAYSCDEDTYKTDGTVTVNVGVDGDEYLNYGFKLSPVSKTYTPTTVDYIRKADQISTDNFAALKDTAVAAFEAEHPGAKFEKAYFGYDSKGNGEQGWFSGHYNSIKFAFSYVENGEKKVSCILFYEVKITSDGALWQDSLEKSSSIEYKSLTEMEQSVAKSWESFVSISA